MAWKVTNPMDERKRFIERLVAGERMVDLCDEFGISRKTGQKFWARFKELGNAGLQDQSRAPKRIQHRTTPEIRELLFATKEKFPSWGAPKIQAWLKGKRPELKIPSVAAVHRWLDSKGLVNRKRARRKTSGGSWNELTTPKAPNEVWCVDFKGQFKLRNGVYCYPLTITDLFSRYLIRVEALEDTATDPARDVFEDAFREHGVPGLIRSDNGTPFASTGLAGLSQLSVWWLRLGIGLERIEPGHPEQNGQHERMHLTLKQETTRPAAMHALQQQERFENFRDVFNNERPHEALGQIAPATVYRPAERPYRSPAPLDYPLHDEIRTVSSSGTLSFQKQVHYVGRALAGECVGLREVEDARWLVTFMKLDLGVLDVRTKRLEVVA